MSISVSTCDCCSGDARSSIGVTSGVRKAERFPVSRKRKPGQPAHRPVKNPRLTANEKDYYEAILATLATIPRSVIREQFEKPIGSRAVIQITEHLELVQPFLSDLTLWQLEQSGALMFNEIKRDVAAQWKTLEKATPSQTALDMKFNRASPNATAYASMSAGNMVRDIARSQVLAVSRVIETAFNEGLTRPQTSQALYQLLNKIPTPSGAVAGNYAVGQIFGDATRGLTVRYADAVVNRATKIMADNPNLSAVQLKKKVDAYGSRLRRSRARMIARTELMRASNQGRLEGMWQAADRGLVDPTLAKKQWVTSSFDVCPICVPLNGVTVGIRDSFGPPGQAPPAHPNCRCTVRMLPDPMTFGLPTSTGTGMTGSPMQLIRPTRPGLKIQDLDEAASGAGVVAAPDELIGQPGAPDELLDGDDIDLPLPTEPVGRVEPMQSEEYFLDNAEKFMDEANSLAAAAGPEQRGMWIHGDYEDYGLKVIAREQGFDSKPAIISNTEMAALESDPTRKILYRGIGADTRQELDGFLDDFLVNTELPYQGQGIYGSGTYTSDSLELAEAYSTRKLGINTARTGGSNWDESQVLKMALDKDAKIIDVEDLRLLHEESLIDPITGKPWRSAADEYRNKADRLKDQWMRDNDISLYGDGDALGFRGYSEDYLDVSGVLREAGFDKQADHVTKLFEDGKIRPEVLLSQMTDSELKLIFDEDVFGFRLGPNNQIPDELSEAGEALFLRERGRFVDDDRGKLLGWGDGLADAIPDPLDGSPGYAANLELSKRAKAIEDLTMDQNRFAAIRGYDAVRVPDAEDGVDFFVLLNRSAISVANPAG